MNELSNFTLESTLCYLEVDILVHKTHNSITRLTDMADEHNIIKIYLSNSLWAWYITDSDKDNDGGRIDNIYEQQLVGNFHFTHFISVISLI